jgi:hypothetical protein
MRSDVAALYVDPGGPYPKLVEHWYDEARDARTYAGPWPVVAHPPCGPWGRLRRFCTRQDASLGVAAVAQVQRHGGVLEHPYGSLLWEECGLPNERTAAYDKHGGFTIVVEQVAWGHVAQKLTWLYVVGRRASDVVEAVLPWTNSSTYGVRKEPTHVVSSTRRKAGGLPEMRKSQRHITPVAFAEWLIQLASRARRTQAA